jgi:hypothetical protein
MSKLLEFQKRVEPIIKDATNLFFKSKYADINSLLATIKPLLNELELVVIQPLIVCDGKNALTTELIDGEKVIAKSAIFLPDNLDPQKIGSAITYYRRYSLQALLALEAEDDDAEGTKGNGNGHKPEAKQPEKPKDRNLTEEANQCKTIEDLQKWYKGLSVPDQTIARAVTKNRKEELLSKVENKPDIFMQTITALTKKNFNNQIKLIEKLMEDHKGEKLPYIEAALAKIKEIGVEYEPTWLPF